MVSTSHCCSTRVPWLRTFTRIILCTLVLSLLALIGLMAADQDLAQSLELRNSTAAPVSRGGADAPDQLVWGSVATLPSGGEIASPAAVTMNFRGGTACTGYWDIKLVDTLAYCALYSGFSIVNAKSPSNLKVMSEMSLPISDDMVALDVEGDYAYIVGRSPVLYVIDVSDPFVPTLVDSLGPDQLGSTGGYEDIVVHGVAAYISSSYGVLLTLDLSYPAAPTVAQTDVGWYARERMDIAGNNLFVTSSYPTLEIWDISTPLAPAKISECNLLHTSPWDVLVDGNYAFVTCRQNSPGYVDIVNISNPLVPTYLTSIPMISSGYPQGMAKNGSILAITNQAAGVEFWDVSAPATPTYVSSTGALDWSHNVVFVGDTALITTAYTGINVFDCQNITIPASLSYLPRGQIYGISQYGDTVLATSLTSPAFHIINVSDPDRPVVLGSLRLGGWGYFAVKHGNYSYVAADTFGLVVVDITNPANPAFVTRFNTPDASLFVAIEGNYAYVCDNTTGLMIFDISVPASPSLVGTYNTPDRAARVAIRSPYAYIGDRSTGLVIVDVSNPAAPTLKGTYNTPGSARGVTLYGDYALVADDYSGVQIVNVSNPSAPVYSALAYPYHGGYVPMAGLAGTTMFMLEQPSNSNSCYMDPWDIFPPSIPTHQASHGIYGAPRWMTVRNDILSVANGLNVQLLDFTATPDPLEEVTAGDLTSGLGPHYGNAWGDYDGDGDEDLYISGQGSAGRLYRNNGDGSFANLTATPLTTATEARSATWVDFDNDGDLDLAVSRLDADKLFRNDGAGVFTDVSTATMIHTGYAGGLNWADYDGDGDLDMFVNVGSSGGNRMLRQDAGSAFVDVTAGPLVGGSFAWGVCSGDYDQDGDVDIYLPTGISGTPARLLRNDGSFVFTDVTAGDLLTNTDHGSASAFGDYDNDGDLDLLLIRTGDYLSSRLFRNDGGTYVDAAVSYLGMTSWCNGVNWSDLDNDGDLDFVQTSSSACQVLYNNGDGSFAYVMSSLLTTPTNAVSFADYDNDGDADFFVSRAGYSPSAMVRNNLNNGNHWLHLTLVGTISNRSAIGALVTTYVGTAKQLRQVEGGSGYMGQNSLTVEFGLGSATAVDSVVIRWPSGTNQIVTPAVDQRHTIVEPAGCCVGGVGNVDCDPGDVVDVSDLTTLIDNLFINFTPLCCEGEANCDGAGGVDVSDLTTLIDNLFINFTSLPACQ